MKRSKINAVIRNAIGFAEKMGFHLPPFAFWSMDEWCEKGREYDEIRRSKLGWDVTDWGKGNFAEWGLLAFTMRNGNVHDNTNMKGYAEKMLIVEDGQKEPFHYHKGKMEDIINRGGGVLVQKLYNATSDGKLSDTRVQVSMDGKNVLLPAGVEIELLPGESLTIFPEQYHSMWAKDGKVLAIEISNTNDDDSDNFFLEKTGRFPEIEEDAPPLFYLCNEYPNER